MEKIENGIWIKKGNTNVGLLESNGEKYLVDTGSNEKFARELFEESEEVDYVLNTHSHADHLQGNHIFEAMGVKIYADDLEIPFIENPFMESFYLYGANPSKILKTSFFKAKGSTTYPFNDIDPSTGIEFIRLGGHSLGMTGVKFKNVLFCGDAYFGEAIIQKYTYPYLVNVREFLDSLEKILSTGADFYIPSHGKPTSDPSKDIKSTKEALMEFVNLTLDSLQTSKGVEELCFEIAGLKEIHLNGGTFYLFRSFESAILSYLEENGEIVNESYGKWHRK